MKEKDTSIEIANLFLELSAIRSEIDRVIGKAMNLAPQETGELCNLLQIGSSAITDHFSEYRLVIEPKR